MWEHAINALSTYGIGAIIAGALLFILYKILGTGMKGLKEDRDNYMKIIEQQNITQNNHIHHLDEAIKTQSRSIATQGERFTSGIDKICGALESQTQVLKEHIRSSRREN